MRTKNYLGAKTKQNTIPLYGEDSYTIVAMPSNVSDNERWKLGGCPRCHGDLFLDREDGQTLGHCLQCGYVGVRILTSQLSTA